MKRGRNRCRSHVFQILDIWIRSRDIGDQSRKLSKIALNFWRFSPSQILRGRPSKSYTNVMTPASRHVVWKMFCENTRPSPEVIVASTLNFKPNFKFSRVQFFGGPPSHCLSDFRYLAPFGRYSRSTSEVVENRPKFCMFLAHSFLGGVPPEFYRALPSACPELICLIWNLPSFKTRQISYTTYTNRAWVKQHKSGCIEGRDMMFYGFQNSVLFIRR